MAREDQRRRFTFTFDIGSLVEVYPISGLVHLFSVFHVICHCSLYLLPDCKVLNCLWAITTVLRACSSGMPERAATSATFFGLYKSFPLPIPSLRLFGAAAMTENVENKWKWSNRVQRVNLREVLINLLNFSTRWIPASVFFWTSEKVLRVIRIAVDFRIIFKPRNKTENRTEKKKETTN